MAHLSLESPLILYLVAQHSLELTDPLLIPPIKRPLLDPLASDQSGVREHPHVLAQGRRADSEFPRKQQSAHPVLDQVSIHLRRKVGFRILEPLQDLESALIGERPERRGDCHIAN
jgi:hypothetical protein